MSMKYNNPPSVHPDVGEQHTYKDHINKAIIDLAHEKVFGQLGSTQTMSKYKGKLLEMTRWYMVLDDRNVNNQGIDSTGATIANGNLYGSSLDKATIMRNLPSVTEDTRRANRIGFKRTLISASLQQFGIFFEFTEDDLLFDNDGAQLPQIFYREAMKAVLQIQEHILNIKLVEEAQLVTFAGSATSIATVDSAITYDDFIRLSLLLDDNRVPKNESFIKGARLVDTLIDKGRRVAYVPTALRPLLVSLRTVHNEKAMTPVEQYSGHNATLNGEIGTIDDFRIVEVPQMIFEEGGGAAPSNPNNTAISAGCCNVYPIITVGQNAFAHIGLESRQGANQFTVLRHMPGMSIDREDIYGKEGRISISWWQGVLVSRPDYISVFWTAAA